MSPRLSAFPSHALETRHGGEERCASEAQEEEEEKEKEGEEDKELESFEQLIEETSASTGALKASPNTTIEAAPVVTSDVENLGEIPEAVAATEEKRPEEKRPEEKRPDVRTAEARERKRQSRKRARHAAARRNRVNTSVYVTGVPTDATEEELGAHFAKCGILLPNPETGRPRIKLYRHADETLKGDALITYALRPSVENALTLLDGASLRADGAALTVCEASFEHKGENAEGAREARDEPEAKRPAVRARDLVEEALRWDDGSAKRSTGTRIVILSNVFDARTADYEVVRQDMEEGCAECGEVERVTVFEGSVVGAVAVRFGSSEGCLACIAVMNGRFYDGRRLRAEFYDGVTDYKHRETEEERVKRDTDWERWLDGGEARDKAG